jgi:hypothetical protein
VDDRSGQYRRRRWGSGGTGGRRGAFSSEFREHREKIEQERSKPDPNDGLIHYWEREIEAFQKGINRVRRRQKGKR